MKKQRTFSLKCDLYSTFSYIKQYLMEKYTVYTAVYRNGIAYFRISY